MQSDIPITYSWAVDYGERSSSVMGGNNETAETALADAIQEAVHKLAMGYRTAIRGVYRHCAACCGDGTVYRSGKRRRCPKCRGTKAGRHTQVIGRVPVAHMERHPIALLNADTLAVESVSAAAAV